MVTYPNVCCASCVQELNDRVCTSPYEGAVAGQQVRRSGSEPRYNYLYLATSSATTLNSFMYYILVLFIWTFVIYWMHRAVHVVPILNKIHADHHKYVVKNEVTWHWSNLFLYNDTWLSTADLWITEVIPTIIMSIFVGGWLFIAYYLWAAFVQERIEHNEKFNWYPFTSGQWHMIHHKNAKYNFGIFIPIWDILFKTSRDSSGSFK